MCIGVFLIVAEIWAYWVYRDTKYVASPALLFAVCTGASVVIARDFSSEPEVYAVVE